MSAAGTTESGEISPTVLMTVNNQDRSRDSYHDVIGAEIIRDRDPAILRLHNGVIVPNMGGNPTDDKPTVTIAPPANPDTVSMALNIRVADIQPVYHAWRTQDAEFLTPPQNRDSEIRCHLRDPDTHHIGLLQVRPGAPRHVVHGHTLSLKLSTSAAVDNHQLTGGEPPENLDGAHSKPLSYCRTADRKRRSPALSREALSQERNR